MVNFNCYSIGKFFDVAFSQIGKEGVSFAVVYFAFLSRLLFFIGVRVRVIVVAVVCNPQQLSS